MASRRAEIPSAAVGGGGKRPRSSVLGRRHHGLEFVLRLPAGGDGLDLGVEVHPGLAVEVGGAHEGRAAAREAEVRQGHGDGHVDADLAAVHVHLEAAGVGAAAGEQGRAVAVGVLVDHGDGVVEGVRLEGDQDRPENLLLVAVHVRGHVLQDRGPHKVPVRVVLDAGAASVQDDLGALLLAGGDQAFDPGLGGGRDHGPEVCGRVGARPELQLLGLGGEVADPLLRLAHEDGRRQRHAALPRGPEGGPRELV
mmetsp:Transcript_97278/g.308569  ORF Transcript_97278/g.308569 Transcript_97278/m.308569 type:complete len:253 (-) Transcript_97278:448-1206(-)